MSDTSKDRREGDVAWDGLFFPYVPFWILILKSFPFHFSRIFHLADSDEEVPLVRAAAIQQLVDLSKLIGPELKTELCLLLTR